MVNALKNELELFRSMDPNISNLQFIIDLYMEILTNENPEKYLKRIYRKHTWLKLGIQSCKKQRELSLEEQEYESNVDIIVDTLNPYVIW